MAQRPRGFFLLPVLCASHRELRAIQHVGVDHRRRDIAVAEQFLHRADVRAGFEQVGGEAVPQRVATDGFRDVRLACGISYGPLQSSFVDVVPPCFSRGRIDIKARCREDVLPSPLAGGAGVFPFEGRPEGRPSVAEFQVPRMDLSVFGKMGGKALPPPIGKDRHPILLSFPVPDRDLPAVQVDVLHPQPQHLHESETASVQQRHRETIPILDGIQQPSYLLPAQYDRQLSGALRSLELPEIAKRRTDDVLEVEDERVERLSLRRCRHPFRDHQTLEECPHGVGTLLDAATRQNARNRSTQKAYDCSVRTEYPRQRIAYRK